MIAFSLQISGRHRTFYTYTDLTLNAFKKVALFGIELGGEAGVPYVTKGTVKSNLKITVQCSFPAQTEPLTATKSVPSDYKF